MQVTEAGLTFEPTENVHHPLEGRHNPYCREETFLRAEQTSLVIVTTAITAVAVFFLPH